jgi:hypothetical protein
LFIKLNSYETHFFLLASFALTASSIAQMPAIDWEHSYGGTNYENAYGITKAPGGGYVLATISESNDIDASGNNGGFDNWIFKIDLNGELQWQKSIGGSGTDIVSDIVTIPSGGYAIAGWTFSNGAPGSSALITGNHGVSDIWVARLNENGEVLWKKTIGGCDRDEIRMLIHTNDGGLMLAGGTTSYNTGDVYGSFGDWDAWVIKLNLQGEIEWQRIIGGTGIDYFFNVTETAAGDFLLAGLSGSLDGDLQNVPLYGDRDCWIAKISNTGAIIWQKRYGGSAFDEIHGIDELPNGNIVFCGLINSNDGQVNSYYGFTDAWVAGTDAQGTLLWRQTIGGSASEIAFAVQALDNNHAIVVGRTESPDINVPGFHGATDGWCVIFNTAGAVVEKRCYGGTQSDAFFNIERLNDENFIMVGSNASVNGDASTHNGLGDVWVVKIGDGGNVATDDPNQEVFELTAVPNPTADQLTVRTNFTGEKRLMIVDASGKILTKQTMKNTQHNLNVANLPAGIYQVQVLAANGKFSRAVSFVKK